MSNLNFNPNEPLVNSQYTPIQVWMALDIWEAASAELADAVDAITGNFPGFIFMSDEQREISGKVFEIVKDCHEICPLKERRMSKHSNERYPVDKALRSASKIRTATKRLGALQAVAA